MGARDLLERLRPSGAPGAASLSGVPADRVAERSAELEPVFALLADAQAEAQKIESDAEREAQRRRDRAVEQARGIVAAARHAADSERAHAAAAAQAGAAEQTRLILADAQRAAEALAEQAGARRPALVAEVVARARAVLVSRVGQTP